MASFDEAYAATEKNEGGYANHKVDTGGETYRGIARKHWPGWAGWEIVDALKSKPGFPKSLASNEKLQELVKDFFRRNFWSYWLDQFQSQSIASWVYDKRVNMGTETAVKLLQRALGITADGHLGSGTLNAVNSADPEKLREKLREQAKTYYLAIVERDPSQKVFLNGWIARA